MEKGEWDLKFVWDPEIRFPHFLLQPCKVTYEGSITSQNSGDCGLRGYSGKSICHNDIPSPAFMEVHVT